MSASSNAKRSRVIRSRPVEEFADTRKGRRPSFLGAAEPGRAAELVEHVATQLEGAGVRVGRGIFGAEMAVDLVNDGPFTVLFDTRV